MNLTPEQKTWIDGASYEQLLSIWRFAPVGDPRLQGEHGTYFAKVMNEKRSADPAGAVAASKSIGWLKGITCQSSTSPPSSGS